MFSEKHMSPILDSRSACINRMPSVVRSTLIRLLLIAGLMSLGLMPVQAETAEGPELFDQLCGECHRSEARILRKIPKGTEDEKKIWLAELLRDHHAPDPATRKQLIEWLSAQ
ncbi:mono/diheme cytochrome c family protein [Labrenzia sp. MBR-25]|jgi:mono/diheme cytochrome c family protein